MDKSKRVLNLTHDDIETFEKKDFDGYAAIDVTEYCFGELEEDPWDTLRFLRALLKDASILILDDSLSAVDTKTETALLANLAKEREGKTTILIAHRISTIQQMDKIVFIDEGKIVAVGTNDELMKTCPAYKAMAELQKLEEEK